MIIRITSKFGAIDSAHKTPHTGVDIGIPEGTTLRAVGEGIVDKVFTGEGAIGKGLSIQFPDGTRAIYGHLSDVRVKVGERIKAGQTVGYSGNTGNSTGPHLHLGLKDADGQVIDPTSLVDRVLANGRVGDGIGDIPYFNIWEWLGGKLAEVTVDSVVNFTADFALAFPFLAVVSGGVYALLNMVSKRVAGLGALGTLIYGLYAIK